MDELIISNELIFSQLTGEFADIVETVSKKLINMDIVRESYPEAILTREKEYPTGLLGKHGGFAIPHTYSKHCKQSAVTLLRPERPLKFTRMDDHNDTVDCGLIVMLAIADPEAQLPMLRKLMKSMQNEEYFRILSTEQNSDVVRETLKKICR